MGSKPRMLLVAGLTIAAVAVIMGRSNDAESTATGISEDPLEDVAASAGAAVQLSETGVDVPISLMPSSSEDMLQTINDRPQLKTVSGSYLVQDADLASAKSFYEKSLADGGYDVELRDLGPLQVVVGVHPSDPATTLTVNLSVASPTDSRIRVAYVQETVK